MNSRVILLIFITILLSSCVPAVTALPTDVSIPTVTAIPIPSAGDMRTDSKGIEQVWVPAGSFMMGTDQAAIDELMKLKPPTFVAGALLSETPQHKVTLTTGYWIDKYEVTNKAFGAFVQDGGYKNQAYWSAEGWKWLSGRAGTQLPRYCQGNLPDNPVACITWYEAEAYTNWRGGRLPTEAEWEYAARGPESWVYPWGNEFDPSLCNVVDSINLTSVGSFPNGASWVEAMDMSGNVMEWVNDWLGEYPTDAVENPTGPETGVKKVEKGGWWGSTLFVARSSYRHFEDAPDYGDMHIGFRVVTP